MAKTKAKSPAGKPPKNAVGSKTDTYATIESQQKTVITAEAEKKRILDKLKAIANRKTSLTVAPFATKPIAHLNQLTPFIKVTLKLPKVNTSKPQTFRTVEYDEIDLFFNPTGKQEGSYFNNYIKSFDYSYEGSGGFKCNLSISDISFDFTDMLLLRFRSLEDTNLTFMDVTFGWTTPEHGMKKRVNGIVFQNTVTFQVQEMNEEDSQFEREIKISGIVTSTFPDAAGLITPYSILGPYPLVTYNFIKYLYDPFDVQLRLMGLIGGDNKTIPKIPVNDLPAKVEFVKNLYLSNLMLGKDDPLKTKSFKNAAGKTTTVDGKSGWLKEIFGSEIVRKGEVTEASVFPNPTSIGESPVLTELKNLYLSAGPTPQLPSSVITKIYNSEVFFNAVKARGTKGTATGPGNPINVLVSKVAPLLKEMRVHPWDAARYFYYTMIEVVTGIDAYTGKPVAPKPEYNFVELDFADVINYSPTSDGNDGRVDKRILDAKEMRTTNKVLGYNSVNSRANLLEVQKDPYIKVFGMNADSVHLTQGTSWDSLIQMAISKVRVNLEGYLDKKEEKEFDEIKKTSNIKKKIKNNGDPEQVVEENNNLFVRENGGKLVAYRFANLNSKMFFASATSRSSIYETIEAMITTKEKRVNEITRLKEQNTIIEKNGGVVSTDSLSATTTVAERTLLDSLKTLKADKTPSSLVLTIFLDRAGSIFGEGFGENNIAQVYSVRFKNSMNGFEATEKRTGTSIGLEFPDVVSFKPNIKNLLDHVRHTLPLTDMFEITSEGANKKISSTYSKVYETKMANLGERKSQLQDKLKKETSAPEKKKIEDELRIIIGEEQAAKQVSDDSKNITIETDPEAIQGIESSNLKRWNERIRFPIRWNTDARKGNGFLQGDEDGEAAMMKTSVVNLKRRMIIHSMSYEAELRVIGDPTFVGTYFTDKLIFMKVLMADGRDSIHTGIYQITGFSHSLNAGAYLTSFKLMKRPDLNSGDNPQLMTQMIKSLSSDPIYQGSLSSEQMIGIAGSSGKEKKKKLEEAKDILNKTAPKKVKLTAAQASATIDAGLKGLL